MTRAAAHVFPRTCSVRRERLGESNVGKKSLTDTHRRGGWNFFGSETRFAGDASDRQAADDSAKNSTTSGKRVERWNHRNPNQQRSHSRARESGSIGHPFFGVNSALRSRARDR